MRGRVYDPLAGRFLSADPVIQAPYWSQGQNPYAYVFNDPINATDPSGYVADALNFEQGKTGGNILQYGFIGAVGVGVAYGLATEFTANVSLSSFGGGSPGAGGLIPAGNAALRAIGLDPFSGTRSFQDLTYKTQWHRAKGTWPGKQGSGSAIVNQTGQLFTGKPPGTSLFDPDAGALATRGARRPPRGAPMPGPGSAPVLRPLPQQPRVPLLPRRLPPGRSWPSHSAMVKELGPAGPLKEWHHIVEQTPGNLQRFGAQRIHNSSNVVRVGVTEHQQISSFYSSVQPAVTRSETLTVRDWIGRQSFEAQQRFGNAILKAVAGF